MILKKIENNKGQSMVEFVLVLPVILILLIGMVEFGLIFNAYLTINNASREAVRMGSVGNSDVAIELRIDEMTTTLDAANLTVTITPGEGFRNRGDSIDVTIDYDYDMFTPFLSNLLGNTISLEAHTVMRME